MANSARFSGPIQNTSHGHGACTELCMHTTMPTHPFIPHAGHLKIEGPRPETLFAAACAAIMDGIESFRNMPHVVAIFLYREQRDKEGNIKPGQWIAETQGMMWWHDTGYRGAGYMHWFERTHDFEFEWREGGKEVQSVEEGGPSVKREKSAVVKEEPCLRQLKT